ncbi:MAG TPA: glycosyltransferase family 87 protein [Alphaproteobacteria bacterium]|nr:glycosyltransferase family 87 protein [Alphaproteobacteria bacterium]
MSTLVERLDRIGPARFAVLLILLPISIFYLAAGLYVVSGEDPLRILANRESSNDFITFWSAAHLALGGTPELAYDPEHMRELERAVLGPSAKFTPWHYPPTFMLAVLPLRLMPLEVAELVWLIVWLVALAWLIQSLFHTQAYTWALLIFPYSVICMISAQNGFMNAFLIGAALLQLDRRPALAGFFCGLLTWKPHLAALIFMALAAGRHWRALASAVATAVALAIVSAAVLGLAPWRAFFDNLSYVTSLLETGSLPWERMPSVYVSARLLGLDAAMARVVQVASALVAVAAVCAIWYRGAALSWRGASIAAALPLMTPYVFDYDLVVLVFAVAWMLNACLREGWQTGDTAILIAVWIGAAVSWPLVRMGGPPFLPFVFALLLAAVWRRAFPRPALSPVPSVGAV